jgi:hypothetical protein
MTPLSPPQTGQPAIHGRPHKNTLAAARAPHDQSLRGDDLSPHARRRLATLLRLKMLELHEEHLDRVRAVIERRLPVSALFEGD